MSSGDGWNKFPLSFASLLRRSCKFEQQQILNMGQPQPLLGYFDAGHLQAMTVHINKRMNIST